MPNNSQAKIAANGRYKVKRYETISFSSPREIGLNAAIDNAAHNAGISKAAYIQAAIVEKLRQDGFGVGEVGTDTGAGNVRGESDTIAMLRRQRDEKRALMEKIRREEEEERQAFWDSVEE